MFLILSKIGSGMYCCKISKKLSFNFVISLLEIDFEKPSFEALYLLCDASLQFQSSTICEVLCNVWPVLLTRCSKEERLLVVVSTALAIARISGEPLLHCAATILGVTLAFLWTLQWFKHKKKNMTQLLKSLELFRKKAAKLEIMKI